MKTILATFSFFTRIPFWKIADLKKEHYQHLVPLWPLAGWLTGGTMALTFWAASFVLPLPVAVLLALISRLLLTGALHEDGFADFWDGFGGGRDRNSILAIMKDSHIGTYGVVALVVYFLLLFTVLHSFFASLVSSEITGCFTLHEPDRWSMLRYAMVFVVADSFAKWTSSNIINILPYSRHEDEAKNKLIYQKMSWGERIMGFCFGCLPAVLFMPVNFIYALVASAVVTMIMIYTFYKKIKGYTGDCCGACFILSELAFYITALAII